MNWFDVYKKRLAKLVACCHLGAKLKAWAVTGNGKLND